jgi:hypothetical protein
VQAGGGSGHRTFLAREYSLVSLAVGGLVPPLDIRGQRDVADLLKFFVNIARSVETQGALAEFAARDHFRFQAAGEQHPFADAHLPAGMHQRFPLTGRAIDGPQQQDFHFSGALGAMPEQARWEHPRIVQNEAIAGAQKSGQVAELPVIPGAARAIDDQHAGGGAIGKRRLRNRLVGQLVIEFGEIHRRPDFTVSERACPAVRLPTTRDDTRRARTQGRAARECA